MDRIILVFYVDIGNISPEDCQTYLSRVNDSVLIPDDNIIQYIIPIRGENSRIECLNPKLVTEQEYISVKTILDKTTEILNNYTNELKNINK
jgi:hypothetical protein